MCHCVGHLDLVGIVITTHTMGALWSHCFHMHSNALICIDCVHFFDISLCITVQYHNIVNAHYSSFVYHLYLLCMSSIANSTADPTLSMTTIIIIITSPAGGLVILCLLVLALACCCCCCLCCWRKRKKKTYYMQPQYVVE